MKILLYYLKYDRWVDALRALSVSFGKIKAFFLMNRLGLNVCNGIMYGICSGQISIGRRLFAELEEKY